MALLAAEHLTVRFPECSTPVLSDVSFSLEPGDFAVICGATGCGKTTLLRMCKRELIPRCTQSGSVLFDGRLLADYDDRTAASQIGFVMQHPEQQIVTDRVWHELAFGLENLGTPPEIMRRRIAEIASYFGMEEWLDRDPASLSGGQKQLLNLASVMIMQPRLLLLDEPTAQLDPIAAADFLTTLQRLNRDFSITILLAEHRLEDVIPVCTQLLLMERGKVVMQDAPRRLLRQLPADSPVTAGMPAAVRLYHALGMQGECPLSVSDARNDLMPRLPVNIRSLPEPEPRPQTSPALTVRDAFFRYERSGRDILNGLSFSVQTGEFYCMIGGNGAGKSTVLAVLSGIRKCYAGKIEIFGKPIRDYKQRSLHQQCVTLLPQDVQTVFLCNTAAEELAEIDRNYETALADFPFDLSPLYGQHPYDLSGGEQQLLALAKVMLTRPRLLLLDEPTKGLDAQSKLRLAEVLHGLQAQGVTVLMVTHDIEFAACHADRCGFLSRGALISADVPQRFFAENAFYTTAASRISRGFYQQTVTVGQIVRLVQENGGLHEAACD
ncbi:MAG: ATP-binding cassette domain-containing protein [Oscillospiraceae bacterium]|nr:ATP-binding cassette domain-containing protein [Oscillospiraceae bacterium]